MTAVPFSWMYKDPAEIMDRLRAMHSQMETEEKRLREQDRRRKARRIRKLTKLAISGKAKGESNAR